MKHMIVATTLAAVAYMFCGCGMTVPPSSDADTGTELDDAGAVDDASGNGDTSHETPSDTTDAPEDSDPAAAVDHNGRSRGIHAGRPSPGHGCGSRV